MDISCELFFVSIERGQCKSLEKKQRNAKSRWKNDSEMQKVAGKKAAKRIKVVGKKTAKRIKVVGKMTATIAKVA